MKRTVLAGLVALAGAALPGPVQAQTQDREPPTLASDRPGLGDGAHVLGAGVWQFEVGVTIDAQPLDEFLVGSALVRYGFSDLELRVFVPSLYVREGNEFLQVGDLGVGVKVPLDLGGGWQWAATGAFTAPIGAEGVSAEDPTLSAALLGQTTLTESVGFAFNVGYGAAFGGLADGTLSAMATPTFAWPGRDDLSVYLGYAGFVRDGEDDHFMEWGVARLEGTERQWDVNAGYNLGRNTWFLGVGTALRLR